MNNTNRRRIGIKTESIGCASVPAGLSIWSIAILLLIVSTLIAGCGSLSTRQIERETLANRAPELNEQLFGSPRPVPEFSEMLALTPEQQTDFLRFFRSQVKSRLEPHKRLYAYLTQELSDVEFHHHTLPASTAVQTRSGNCMSLALVTAAYARLADIEIDWQLSETDPVYSLEGSVIYSANHIQTRLYQRNYSESAATFLFTRSWLLVDYFTGAPPRGGKILRKPEVIAHVYQNMGAEAMTDGRLEDAFWLLREGLSHDTEDPNLYNALAVLHRRAGDEQTAEQLYRFTLDEFGDQLIVLRNYHRLLLNQSRAREADELNNRIMALRDPDPFPLLSLGDEAADSGNLDLALNHYRRAGDIAPYLPEVHLRIARVHAHQGNLRRAQRALREARDRARNTPEKERYEAKLAALESR